MPSWHICVRETSLLIDTFTPRCALVIEKYVQGTSTTSGEGVHHFRKICVSKGRLNVRYCVSVGFRSPVPADPCEDIGRLKPASSYGIHINPCVRVGLEALII